MADRVVCRIWNFSRRSCSLHIHRGKFFGPPRPAHRGENAMHSRPGKYFIPPPPLTPTILSRLFIFDDRVRSCWARGKSSPTVAKASGFSPSLVKIKPFLLIWRDNWPSESLFLSFHYFVAKIFFSFFRRNNRVSKKVSSNSNRTMFSRRI